MKSPIDIAAAKEIRNSINRHVSLHESKFAQILGLSKSCFSSIKSGRRNWSLTNFFKTMALLGKLDVEDSRLILHWECPKSMRLMLDELADKELPPK